MILGFLLVNDGIGVGREGWWGGVEIKTHSSDISEGISIFTWVGSEGGSLDLV